jgi:hypothetical protein
VREWETDVQYAAYIFTAFFVVVRDGRGMRILATALLASFATLAALAIAMALLGRLDLHFWHHDAGFWSTHLVLVAPVLFALFAKPAGARTTRRSMLLFVGLLALLLVNARLTDNRMVWVALAASYGTAALVAVLRCSSCWGTR